MNQLIIPPGYVLVPESWADKYFKRIGWGDIATPTIKQTAEYIGVSVEKIKKDLRNYECPLRKVNSGARGKGNQMTFLKQSVEIYKDWLQK